MSLYAQPYDLDAQGFSFDSFESFERQSKKNFNNCGQLVEEYEIQYIDGNDGELFRACGIDQGSLEQWFDDIENLDDHEKAQLFFLMQHCGINDLNSALNKKDDVCIVNESLEDAAIYFADEYYLHDAPEFLKQYFNYEAFARDLKAGGDFIEFDFAGETYTCTNSNIF